MNGEVLPKLGARVVPVGEFAIREAGGEDVEGVVTEYYDPLDVPYPFYVKWETNPPRMKSVYTTKWDRRGRTVEILDEEELWE